MLVRLLFIILLFPSIGYGQALINIGTPVISLNANNVAAPQTGTAYALPVQGYIVTWITSFATQPTSHTTQLQLSNDNVIWVVGDTTTNVLGESRTIFTAARFVRTVETARSGGTSITTSINVGRGAITTIATNPNSFLIGGATLTSDGTNQLAQRNGTAPQTFRLYNTYTDASNYERAELGWTGNVFGVLTGGLGTGLSRALSVGTGPTSTGVLNLQTGGVNRWIVGGSTGHITAGVDNTYDIGASGVTRPRSGYFGTFAMAPSLYVGAVGTAVRLRNTLDGVLFVENSASTIGSTIKVDALPTVASGFGTSPSVTAGSTPFAGSVNVGTGGVATTGTITFNGAAFPSIPFCVASAWLTSVAVRVAPSTTQLVLTAASGAFTASDLIQWHCISPK